MELGTNAREGTQMNPCFLSRPVVPTPLDTHIHTHVHTQTHTQLWAPALLETRSLDSPSGQPSDAPRGWLPQESSPELGRESGKACPTLDFYKQVTWDVAWGRKENPRFEGASVSPEFKPHFGF